MYTKTRETPFIIAKLTISDDKTNINNFTKYQNSSSKIHHSKIHDDKAIITHENASKNVKINILKFKSKKAMLVFLIKA